MYFAVIGDMVNSRGMEPSLRRAAQDELANSLAAVNASMADDIAAGFVITLGDEFQGLMHSSGDPMSAVISVMNSVRCVSIRYAIGMGSITTVINSSAALGADGPAFYNARKAMNIMKEHPGSRLCICTGSDAVDEELNTVALLTNSIAGSMTGRQLNMCTLMLGSELCGKRMRQRELADMFGITQGAVSLQLASADYKAYAVGIKYISKRLKQLTGG